MTQDGVETRPYTPLALANGFIERAARDDEQVDHLKLQKLVYCALGWWLSFRDMPLLNEEPQAWRYGPVFNSLFHTLKPYGLRSIEKPVKQRPFADAPGISDEADPDVAELLDFVWDRYKHLTGWELAELTHKEGTPWYYIYVDQKAPMNSAISPALIKTEFETLYAKERPVGEVAASAG